ncbi:MAG: cytochrome c biogenesis protein CcsA [Alphaproteobacteria bacterium]|nr:cytochrome c biogenesis protein CcsA [Alphaproteobacteria bacterium]
MKWEYAVGLLGLALLIAGHGMGLFMAPPEAMMGDVGRILYAHVPTAWIALLTYVIAFITAVGALWTGRIAWDAAVESTVEVGLVLNTLLMFQGAMWAKPTWGVFWDWDPRLTTTAVMAVSFLGVLILRSLITQPPKRLMASAVATIVASVNVPIVYKSVQWWNSLHQPMSSPETVDSTMVLPLRVAAFGMLFIGSYFLVARWRIALARLEREQDAPDLPETPEAIHLEASP